MDRETAEREEEDAERPAANREEKTVEGALQAIWETRLRRTDGKRAADRMREPESGSHRAPASEKEIEAAAEDERSSPTERDPVQRLLEAMEQVALRETLRTVLAEPEWKTGPEHNAAYDRNRTGAARYRSGARELYRRVNAAWMRESSAAERSTTVYVEGTEPLHGLTLKEVDRAVQLDARRYDGGIHAW